MSTIQQELDLSNKYKLELFEYTYKGKRKEKKVNLVKLSRDNVARIEAMISIDSGYKKNSDRDSGPDDNGKYKGSTAYRMCELKKAVNNNQNRNEEYKEVIRQAVEAVDRENSTHLNADSIGREEITDRIYNLTKGELKSKLQTADIGLINLIAAKTTPKDKSKKARTNVSFASKFCHYACFYLFEGEPEQDNFSIYDNVLKDNIPYYAQYYDVQIKDLSDYADYRRVVDEIIKKSESNISRNGFDHLLWYYHKGR